VAAVGYLFVRGVLDIPMLSARPNGKVVESSLVSYVVFAFAAGLVATGLAHALLLTTPRPRIFFGWIIGLATAAAFLVPMALDQSLASRLATAVVNMIIGITIGALVGTAVGASRRYPAPPPAFPR
jgi:predicted outer membrane lipoprotein